MRELHEFMGVNKVSRALYAFLVISGMGSKKKPRTITNWADTNIGVNKEKAAFTLLLEASTVFAQSSSRIGIV
ncbi:hypothetical protein DMC15_02155 [Vibrio sp. 11986-1-5]|nr:hypothetical protein DMC15_02155 [Vibrio sp. 11986-1-5]